MNTPNTNSNDENLPEYLRGVSDKTKSIPLAQATPLKAKMPQSKGKPVPTVYRHVIKVEWYRRFTWSERLAILFGSGLVVMEGIATQHSPGAFQPLLIGKVTKSTTPDDFMRSVCENMIEEREKGAAQVIHEPQIT